MGFILVGYLHIWESMISLYWSTESNFITGTIDFLLPVPKFLLTMINSFVMVQWQ